MLGGVSVQPESEAEGEFLANLSLGFWFVKVRSWVSVRSWVEGGDMGREGSLGSWVI